MRYRGLSDETISALQPVVLFLGRAGRTAARLLERHLRHGDGQ